MTPPLPSTIPSEIRCVLLVDTAFGIEGGKDPLVLRIAAHSHGFSVPAACLHDERALAAQLRSLADLMESQVIPDDDLI